jgi:hypothetical protein
VSEPPRITDFKVIQGRDDGSSREIGTIGTTSFETRCGDWIRVEVRFDSPVRCFLIALNSDGTVKPCYPNGPTERPAAVKDVGFPAGVTSHYALTDGPGLQAFVVLATRGDLAYYEQWAKGVHWPWKHFTSAGVWHFDGRWIRRSAERRGEITTDTHTPQVFKNLCEFLQKLPEIEVRQAIAFPVRPKE